MIATIKRWWRSRLDVPIDDDGNASTAVTSTVCGCVYSIEIIGGPLAGHYAVKARWYDNPTTIAWKLRRELRRRLPWRREGT